MMLLADDHSELDAALAAVFSALAAGDVELSYMNLDLFWAHLAVHIRAENVCLFPTLLQASERSPQTGSVPPRETVREIITRLRADHEFFMSELAGAMRELRELHQSDRQDSPRILAKVQEQISRVHDRLKAHNELEESQVYHWAGALLDGSEQKELNAKLQLELNNVPARFQGP
jgi:choline dehydrogenase-like flavoprotein